MLDRIRTELDQAGARLLGFVMTQVESSDRSLYPAYLVSPYFQESKEPRQRWRPWKAGKPQQ